MKKSLDFRGVYTALITPFNIDGSIDEEALKDFVEWQIEEKVDGLVPTGTTGESPTLSHEEHARVIQIVVEQTKGRIPVIAGTGSNSTKEAIELTQLAKDLGATASLQVTPYYNKPSQSGIYEHFMSIADQVDLPQVLYNIPGRTSKLIEIDTMLRLFPHPNIIAVKEATGNISYTMDIIEKNQDVSVLAGDDSLSMSLIAQGGHGVISVLSNIAPRKMVEMIHTLLAKDFVEGKKLFYALYPLMKTMFIETNPIPVKFAASKLDHCKEIYRLPLCELEADDKAKIEKTIEVLRQQ